MYGAVKFNKGVPPGTLIYDPYGLIVPVGNTITSLPDPNPGSSIVWYATVPVAFVHVNTGEFPGSTVAYVPVVFVAATKLGTHLSYV